MPDFNTLCHLSDNFIPFQFSDPYLKLDFTPPYMFLPPSFAIYWLVKKTLDLRSVNKHSLSGYYEPNLKAAEDKQEKWSDLHL